MNKTVMNVGKQVTLQDSDFIFFRYISRSELTDFSSAWLSLLLKIFIEFFSFVIVFFNSRILAFFLFLFGWFLFLC